MVKEVLIKKKAMSIYMDPAIAAKLDLYCYRKDISKNHVIVECLNKHLQEDYFDKDSEFKNMMKEGWNVRK